MSEINARKLLPVTNRYELIECVREFVHIDTTWAVYKAHDLVLGKTVYLKILTDGQIDQFDVDLRAKSLGRISHNDIEKVIDHGRFEESPYFVVDCFECPTLKESLIRHPQLTLDSALSLFVRICELIEYIHCNDLVHGNLNLDTILVSDLLQETFDVKIVGLESARVFHIDEDKTSDKKGYLNDKASAQRIDLNALGNIFGQVISYENGMTVDNMEFAGAFRKAERDGLLCRRYGFGVMERIINRCLDVNSPESYKSIFALKRELLEARASLSTWSQAQPVLKIKPKYEKKRIDLNLLKYPAIALVLIIVLALLIVLVKV